MRARQPDVGQMPRQVQRIGAVMRRLAEYRGQVGRIRGDLRRHHHDVAMLQPGIVGEAAQQRVFQHLQLAQPRVAGVHAQAGVSRIGRRCADQLRLQAAEARLQSRQQRGGAGQRLGLVERIAFLDRLAFVQRDAEILRDAAQRHQQRVADLVVQGVRIALLRQLESARAQIRPVLAAGVGKIQVHRRVPRARLQRGQHIGRQVADAEHVQRLVAAVAMRLQRVQQRGAAPGAVRPADRRLHCVPQLRLPVAAGAAAALLPVEDPVRPVDQVLGVQAGEMLGQLKAAPRGIVAAEVGADVRRGQRRQRHQQAPAQHLAPVGAADQRLVAEHAPRRLLEPLPRQDHRVVGGDAVAAVRPAALREAPEQPALQPGMRHHHGLRGQRIGRPLRFQQPGQRIGQPLGAAAAVDDQCARVFSHPLLPSVRGCGRCRDGTA